MMFGNVPTSEIAGCTSNNVGSSAVTVKVMFGAWLASSGGPGEMAVAKLSTVCAPASCAAA